jgi:two-component system response regulator AtoC
VPGFAEQQRVDAEGADASLPARVAALEQRAIEEALAAEQGNQSRAAARLGISERALRYKLAKYRGR